MKEETIHSTAVVSPKAELGKDVVIGPGAIISDRVVIGDGCNIGPLAVIYPHTTLGTGCKVHSHAVLGDLPQDLAFEDIESYVKIGDNCVIREGVTIHRGTKPKTTTVVGNRCYLMALSHLAHNCRLGDKVILANNVMLGGYVEVGDGVFMGGGAGVHQFVHIGRLVMIGGNSGLSKDVPPFCMTRTVEYDHLAGLNVVGLRRAGIDAITRKEIKRAFKLLYTSDLSASDAASRIREEFDSGPALEMAEFVEKSERGICRMRGTS